MSSQDFGGCFEDAIGEPAGDVLPQSLSDIQLDQGGAGHVAPFSHLPERSQGIRRYLNGYRFGGALADLQFWLTLLHTVSSLFSRVHVSSTGVNRHASLAPAPA